MKKKTNIYYRKSDGTYYYDKTINGNRFYKFGFKSQKAAEEALCLDLNLLNKNKITNVDLSSLFKDYQYHLSSNYSINTVYNKMCFINKYIKPFFINYKIKNIFSNVFDLWRKSIIKQTKMFSCKHTNKIIFICKSFFEYVELKTGYYTGYKSLFKIKDLDIQKPKEIWSLEEFEKFISVIDDYNYLVLFHLMFYYGLRLGEAVGLKFVNVDFNNSQIHIVSQVVNNIYKHKAEDSTLKTKTSNRSFYIDEFTCKLIKNLYDPDKVYVFGKKNKPLGRTTIRTHFNNYIIKSGVPKIVIHSLRRSCSTYLYNNIDDVKLVGTLLGHSDESITFHYIQAKNNKKLKMLAEMKKLVNKEVFVYDSLKIKTSKVKK